jgi:hypothetical protein
MRIPIRIDRAKNAINPICQKAIPAFSVKKFRSGACGAINFVKKNRIPSRINPIPI